MAFNLKDIAGKAADAEKSGDVLGGFKVWDTDAYEAVIKVAYLGEAPSGAMFVGLHAMIEGTEYREQIYFTSGREKGQEPFYIDKNTGKKRELPGFQLVNELCLLTTGADLGAQEQEEKTLSLYDPDAQGEINKNVPTLVNLAGEKIILGIQKTIEDKTRKDGNTRVATGETREANNIAKVFHAETQGTVTEYVEEKPLGGFFTAWVEQNKGKVRNNAKGAKGGAAPGRPGQPPVAGGEPSGGAPGANLFGKKK